MISIFGVIPFLLLYQNLDELCKVLCACTRQLLRRRDSPGLSKPNPKRYALIRQPKQYRSPHSQSMYRCEIGADSRSLF